MKYFKYIFFFFVLIYFSNCRQHYDIPVNSTNQTYLVVEGNINSGNGPTTIVLSHTFKLADTANVTYESNAQVAVTGNDNSIHPLVESSAGTYSSPDLGLNNAVQYRLSIKTAQGKQYYSDYMKPITNPPIDTVNFKQSPSGVTIYVNTHDATNSALYYKWDYEETWEIQSTYNSSVKAVFPQDTVVARSPSEMVYICYKYRNSTKVLLSTTTNLSSDIISMFPLVFIPSGAEELQFRYSILVNQYALTKAGYEYYNILKKNTESIGSLFDAQPSDISGNIHSVSNPGEQVIGYMNICPTRQQRIFIVNDTSLRWDYQPDCSAKKYIANSKDSLKLYLPSWSVYAVDQTGPNHINGYYSAKPECVDCTVRGGSTQKPAYW